ncbi:MAG: 50S ribosomal protein L10 [Planctomycetaceae bacterium]|nr:50S ribosomal protein L10 [Planctomycetaceae bacterium]
MSRVVKEMILQEIENRLDGTRDLVVIDSSRLDAVSDNTFRIAMQDKGIHLLTVKNSLIRRVLGDDSGELKQIFTGSSTVAWGGEDVVALSREITGQVKGLETLELKGGSIEGQPLDSTAVERLAKSPGRLELISIISGQALSPGAKLAGALLGPGGHLAGCVKTIADKDEE